MSKWRLAIVGGCVLACFALVVAFAGKDWFATSTTQAATTTAPTTSGTPGSTAADLAQRSNFRAQRDLERFRDDAEELLEELEALDRAAKDWETDVLPLRTNNDGKLLAAKTAYAEAAALLLEKERVTAAECSRMRRTVDSLLEPVTDRLADKDFVPLEEDRRAERDQLGARVRSALAAYSDDLDAVRGLLAAARSENLTPSTTALGQALADLRMEHAAKAAQRVSDQRAADEAAALTADQKRAELRRRALDPDVQRPYSAFLTKGTYNPTSNSVVFQRPPGTPVMVKVLRKWNVLDSVTNFAGFACVRHTQHESGAAGYLYQFGNNDRPGATDFPTDEAGWELWRNRLEEFQELMPIWLEEGLLVP